MDPKLKVNFPELFPHQLDVLHHFATYNVLCWGAQAGKTWFSSLFEAARALQVPGNYVWVDRDGKFARRAFRQMHFVLPKAAITDESKVDLFYRLCNGSTWSFFSGQEPDAFRGERRTGVVLNEASFIPVEAWEEVLAPRLAGWALFNFTPKGQRNWTFDIWNHADGRDANWRRWHATSAVNPTNNAAKLAEIKLALPDSIYKQEIMAEFVSDFGQFFKPAAICWSGQFESYDPNGRYAAGIDWAEIRDFSSFAIIRTDVLPRRVVNFGRLPHMEYTAQIPVLAAKLKAYGNPICLADASQTTANQLLRQQGCKVEDFKFTHQSKQYIADQLRVAFEQGEIVIPSAKKALDEEQRRQTIWLADEIEYFEPYLQGGRMKLGTRGEHHDDILAAIMMGLEAGSRKVIKPWVEIIAKDERDPERIWNRI